MRLMKLVSNIGEVDLNSRTNFFNRPQGFGFSFANQYFRSGNSQSVIESIIELPSFAGDIVFWRRPTQHADFEAFVDYIANSEWLQLHYQPADTQYFVPITIELMSKGEIEENGMLTCPILIRALKPWQLTTTLPSIEIKQIAGGGKTYTYSYPFTYASSDSVHCYYFVRGHFSAGVSAIIVGACVDPVLKGTVNGIEVFNMTIHLELEAGDVLQYMNVDGEENVTLNGTSVVDELNLSKRIFDKLPNGKNVKISLSATTGTPAAVITVYEFYRAV